MNEKKCEECGDPIPQKRLAAVPGATHCVGCASANHEPIRAGDRRVMGALVQRAEGDLEHHQPEPHE